MTQPPSTITVTTRRRAWLKRLTVTHPEHPPPPPPAGTPHYDTDRALELFTRTATMPATKHDLKIVLTEYRRALHALLAARP